MSRLERAVHEMKEHLELNGGYPYDDEDNSPNDVDAMEALMDECGQDSSGACSLAGTEQCDFECPFSE